MPKKAITKELVEYDITTADIQEMRQKFTAMKITNAESDKAVRAARTFMVSQRSTVEKARVKANEEANKWRRGNNEKAKQIITLLLAIEQPLQAECKRVDDEKDRIREDKARIERERVEGIRAKISEIQSMGGAALAILCLRELRELSDKLENMEITSDEYQECKDEANTVMDDTYNTIQDAITTRIKLDEEEKARKAEAERLKKIAEKQKEAQKKIDQGNRKVREGIAKLADNNKAEADRKEKENFERQATEKAEAAAAQKLKDVATAEEERAKTVAAEKDRQEALAPDKNKLIDFANDMLMMPKRPILKSSVAKDLLSQAILDIQDIAATLKERAEEL